MNTVVLVGNLVRDPDVRYTSGAEAMAVATFTIAVNRMKRGEADFPRIVVFGKQAENCERYLSKGSKVAVEGRIQTGSYKKNNGETVYTTDVVANRVEFIGRPENREQRPEQRESQRVERRYRDSVQDETPENFEALNEKIPF